MSVPNRFLVRADSVDAYSPANHTGTVNRRLIGPETVGAQQLEVVLGIVEKRKGAQPHSHPGIEQVSYMLEGRARAEVAGQGMELGPGNGRFFPADAPHVFTVTSEEPPKALVIYAPPYGIAAEDGSTGVTPMHRHNPLVQVIVGLASAAAPIPVVAQKKYDPGASDTEIKIGPTKPHSGPASASQSQSAGANSCTD